MQADRKRVAVIGAGGWGTAVALVLAKKGHTITLWARRKEFCAELQRTRENSRYLPGVLLPANIEISYDMPMAVAEKDVIVIATPAKAVRQAVRAMAGHIASNTLLVSLSKGFEQGTLFSSSQVIAEELGNRERVVVISGPNHAEEVARDLPSATVAAAYNTSAAETIQDIFITPKFRVYTNPDIVGVEVAGALKNIIALAAGICDGLGYGDNTKAALMTRGGAEIARLGVKMGAQSPTFAGLAGIGDLIATCTSKHSRNWRTGYALGQGESLKEILDRSGMVVEGVATTEAGVHLAKKYDVTMPITQALAQILFEDKSPHMAVTDLMLRGMTDELYGFGIDQQTDKQ